jgi:hypothetical protein
LNCSIIDPSYNGAKRYPWLDDCKMAKYRGRQIAPAKSEINELVMLPAEGTSAGSTTELRHVPWHLIEEYITSGAAKRADSLPFL